MRLSAKKGSHIKAAEIGLEITVEAADNDEGNEDVYSDEERDLRGYSIKVRCT